MKTFYEKFVIDDKGERVGVILTMEDYQKILEELEELESIQAYDRVKASGEKVIPFEQAVKEIEEGRYE